MAKIVILLFVTLGVVSTLQKEPSLSINDLYYQNVPADGQHGILGFSDVVNSRNTDDFNPDVQNIYHLFTRNNPTYSQPIVLGAYDLVTSSYYDPSKRTIVLIHGWMTTVVTEFNTVLIPAFLTAEDVNVIAVDWSHGSNATAAFENAVTSGRSTARFITWLNDVTGASLDMYHIVGYSLGAHKAGIVGRNLGGKAAYITALDAAGGIFHTDPERFHADDGIYTESIHTNAGRVAFLTPLGKVSFYPNGGVNMPGCVWDGCNHARAYFYFGESIVSGGFTGVRCATYVNAIAVTCDLDGSLKMGGLEPKTGESGVFFLETNGAPPFSRG